MSMIRGLLAVASRAAFRGPAAAQTLERRLRYMVANPQVKASDWSLIRPMNLLIVAFDATGSKRSGAARSWSTSAACSPPAANESASAVRILPSPWVAVCGHGLGEEVFADPTEVQYVQKPGEHG